MPRIATPLSSKQIENAKPREREYVLSDGFGLQLRVMKNGTKSWRFVYQNPITRQRARLSMGTFPALTLAKARKLSTEHRELVAQGIDPKSYLEEKHREYLAMTQNTLLKTAQQWFEIKKHKVTEDYANDTWRSLELHIFPELKSVPIVMLSAPDVINVLKRLEQKGSLETVRRLCQRLNEIMTFAMNSGLRTDNPLSGIKSAFKKPVEENMKAIEPSELPRLMSTIANASIKRTTRCLLEFQLHTMTRPNEAAGARWDEIDLDKRLWTIPPERMKRRLEHRVPLTNETLKILNIMRDISGHLEYVFPADRNPKKHMNNQTANSALKRMGYYGKLVAHGFRSIASTALNEHGFASDHIEAALAHTIKVKTRKVYCRTDFLDQRIPMMEWWSNFIISSSHGRLSMINIKND
ncbi:integrase [Vibrionales bacterium C3R12]|nr:integrase [Vibrionales bacterium C3R12]